jgi:hypothetical protein
LAAVSTRQVTIRGQAYPLVLPSLRDPRLHVAAVIITIHVLGQLGLDFRVSVPQILAAILASAIIEVVLTFRQSRAIVWPASAMLTGSGVALILRVVGTPAGDHWTFYGWEVFAAVAGGSLLTKYLIRYRGTHVFNPSNVGLVAAFVLLGNPRVEPLDFWWAPLDAWMLIAYAVIVIGGLLITRRLGLLALAAAYWLVLAAGIGTLAASGHCMTTNWAFAPVCGVEFWRVIVTSPEVLVFLFFMITDPKTVPGGRVGRIAFGLLVGLASTLLIAPQSDEFGAKVALLTSLVVVCAARPLLDRLVPEPRSEADDPRRFAVRLLWGADEGAAAPGGGLRWPVRVGAAGMAVLVAGAGIVAAGTPARVPAARNATELLDRTPYHFDPATFPAITFDQEVADWDPTLPGAGLQQILLTLAENLAVENEALLQADETLLTLVDHGDRLAEMQARLRDARATGTVVIERYRFEAVHVVLLKPFGVQSGLSLGFQSQGTLTEETYADGHLEATRTSPFASTFVVRRATGARWLDVAVLPLQP